MADQLPEPSIIQWGRGNVAEYPEREFRESLYRAFIWQRADFIVLDSSMRNNMFLAACAAWGLDNGLLRYARTESDGQSEVYEFRLTELGRANFEQGGG